MTVNELTEKWLKLRGKIAQAAAPFDAQLAEIQALRSEATADFAASLADVEQELKRIGLATKQTINHASGVVIGYRKGATRISYDWRVVDTVAAALGDKKPKLAAQLLKARKKTVGNPSASVKMKARR